MRHRVRDYAEYGLVRGMTALVGRLPHRAALGLGWLVARLGFLFSRRRMKKFERRIGQVFGGSMSPRERRRVLWLAWRNLVFNGIEAMRTPLVTLDWIRRVTAHEDVRMLFDNMKDGRGVVLAVPHMGNWELAGVASQLFGAQLMIIVRRQKNMLTYEWLNRVRASAGLESFLREAHSFTGIVKGPATGQGARHPAGPLGQGPVRHRALPRAHRPHPRRDGRLCPGGRRPDPSRVCGPRRLDAPSLEGLSADPSRSRAGPRRGY